MSKHKAMGLAALLAAFLLAFTSATYASPDDNECAPGENPPPGANCWGYVGR
jgi:hypothetical protein